MNKFSIKYVTAFFMKFNIVLVASIIALLAFPTYALSGEKGPAILTSIDSPHIQVLEANEIKSTRGQYFSSYHAALAYCIRSGCIGPIEKVSGGRWDKRWPYKYGSWRVKTIWGKYLQY